MNSRRSFLVHIFIAILCRENIFIASDNVQDETVSQQGIAHPLINFTFPPDLRPPGSILTVEEQNTTVFVTYQCYNCHPGCHLSLKPRVEDEEIVRIVDEDWGNISIDAEAEFTGGGNITFVGIFIGKSSLAVDIVDHENLYNGWSISHIIPVNTRRPDSIINTIFYISTAILVTINTIAFSCAIDVQVVKEYLRKPIGIVIAFICQYALMPSIAFGLATAFRLEDSLALGLLAYGASPGGGNSNMWTIMFDGDMNLSLTMTLISTVSSLGMTTLWISTLGSRFIGGSKIPFTNMLQTLGLLVASCIVGLLIKRFLPKVAAFLIKALKPFNLIIVIFFVIFGVISNLYIWKLVTYKVLIPAMLISWTGYVIAFGIEFLFRRPFKECRTVAIETGCQNGGVAILIVRYSLPVPDGELAIVAPLMAMITSNFPLILLLIGVKLQDRFCKKKDQDDKIEDNKKDVHEEDNQAFKEDESQAENSNKGIEHYKSMSIIGLERKLSVVSSQNVHLEDNKTNQSREKDDETVTQNQVNGHNECKVLDSTVEQEVHVDRSDSGYSEEGPGQDEVKADEQSQTVKTEETLSHCQVVDDTKF